MDALLRHCMQRAAEHQNTSAETANDLGRLKGQLAEIDAHGVKGAQRVSADERFGNVCIHHPKSTGVATSVSLRHPDEPFAIFCCESRMKELDTKLRKCRSPLLDPKSN
eukprot:scaffold366291_cov19-Prasinocladus_malaysianus.AAC.1